MARTTLTRTTPLGPYPTLPVAALALDVTMAAADTSNLNQILLDGPMIVLVQNTAGVPGTVTLTSSADSLNRTGDIATYTVAAGGISAFKIDQTNGWKQTDGYLYLQASATTMKLGAIRLG